MAEPEHTLSYAYERLGDDNVVVVRCSEHPDFTKAFYTWPTADELLITGREHDPNYDWVEHYRWH